MPTPFDYLSFGASVLGGFANKAQQRNTNRSIVASTDASIEDLTRRISALKKAAKAKKGLVRGRYGEKVRDVDAMLGNTVFDVVRAEENVMYSSDLIRPEGAIGEEQMRRAFRGHRSQTDSLTEWLGTTIADIESQTTSQISEAEAKIKQLKIEREAADEATRGLGAYLPF